MKALANFVSMRLSLHTHTTCTHIHTLTYTGMHTHAHTHIHPSPPPSTYPFKAAIIHTTQACHLLPILMFPQGKSTCSSVQPLSTHGQPTILMNNLHEQRQARGFRLTNPTKSMCPGCPCHLNCLRQLPPFSYTSSSFTYLCPLTYLVPSHFGKLNSGEPFSRTADHCWPLTHVF